MILFTTHLFNHEMCSTAAASYKVSDCKNVAVGKESNCASSVLAYFKVNICQNCIWVYIFLAFMSRGQKLHCQYCNSWIMMAPNCFFLSRSRTERIKIKTLNWKTRKQSRLFHTFIAFAFCSCLPSHPAVLHPGELPWGVSHGDTMFTSTQRLVVDRDWNKNVPW